MLSALLMCSYTYSFSGCEQSDVHVESFVVCIVGKMAQDRDGVKVLWCHSAYYLALKVNMMKQ